MTQRASEVLRQALALSTDERADLVFELIASVDGGQDEDAETAWIHEIERRAEQARTGATKGEEWGAVRARVERRLQQG